MDLGSERGVYIDPWIRFDIAGVKDPDVRRVTPEQPLQWYHSYQVANAKDNKRPPIKRALSAEQSLCGL